MIRHPAGGVVMTLSLVATPHPEPAQSFEADPLDIRLHAPTRNTARSDHNDHKLR